MPGDCKDFPVCYTDEERALLKGSHMLYAIDIIKGQIKSDYSIICKEVPEMEKFDFNDYVWCFCLALS